MIFNSYILRRILFVCNFAVITIAISSCEDSCEGVVCYNSGICDDGKCKCPATFTGTNCETAVNIEDDGSSSQFQVRFNSIQLIDFPDLDNGQPWDLSSCGGSGPDIYLTVEDSTGVIYTSEVLVDCQPGIVYSFSNSLPFRSSNAYWTFVFKLYDKDDGACAPDEYMAGIQGKLTDSNAKLLTSKQFNNPASEISLQLSMSY